MITATHELSSPRRQAIAVNVAFGALAAGTYDIGAAAGLSVAGAWISLAPIRK